jgi:catechol 2,3-dioxygenase-like lactoylglutathione lyase family enzyme
MKVRIIDTAFVGYPAQNMARSRAFYEGILGFNFAQEPVVMESCSMAVITDPDGNLITIHSLAPSRRNS